MEPVTDASEAVGGSGDHTQGLEASSTADQLDGPASSDQHGKTTPKSQS